MFRTKNLIIATALLIICFFAMPTYASFFGDTVHTVRVYFYTTSYWTQLLANKTTETYMPCWVVFDGVDTLDSVGIRLKGNSSYSHPGNKKSFHLKFDQYRDGQKYKDLGRMTFNNCFHDPTFMREHLACEACHSIGVPCSRSCWSVVYYNNTYWGFYSTVDPINKDALTRFFGENDGNLYNCEREAYLTYLGSSPSLYTNKYLKETNVAANDYSDLINFCNFLTNSSNAVFSAQIYNWMDPIDFARVWAVNNYLVNLDSYEGFGRNYFCYFTEGDRIFHYIMYDLNMAFGGFNQYGFSMTTLETLKINWWNGTRPLASRCFNNWAPFWGLVYCADRELLETVFNPATFSARVTELANLIRPYVYADVNKQYTNAAFEQNLDTTFTESGGPPGMGPIPGLRRFIRARSNYIASRIGACARINVAGRVLINEVMPSNATTIADEVGEFDDWLEFFNPADTAIDISHWWITDDINEPRKWKLPIGAVIPPRGYMLVWADRDPEQGPYHASFRLDANRDMLALFGSDFIGAQLCDSVSWPDMPRDSSWGRYPNGTIHWRICRVATPNAENIWGSTDIAEADKLPEKLSIATYPNPFNSSVRISVEGYRSEGENQEAIGIRVFDINGQIAGESLLLSPRTFGYGPIVVQWTPDESIGSGTYFVNVTVGTRSATEKIVYLK